MHINLLIKSMLNLYTSASLPMVHRCFSGTGQDEHASRCLDQCLHWRCLFPYLRCRSHTSSVVAWHVLEFLRKTLALRRHEFSITPKVNYIETCKYVSQPSIKFHWETDSYNNFTAGYDISLSDFTDQCNCNRAEYRYFTTYRWPLYYITCSHIWVTLIFENVV